MTTKTTKADLEREVERLRDKLKDAEREKTEALDLVAEMREHIEDHDATLERWIEVFKMWQDDAGVYQFEYTPGDVWEEHQELLSDWNQLIARWNKFVPKYNATIHPRDRGRPLAASEAQVDRVRSLRKGGMSLRAIVRETALGMSTVRTIVGNADGTNAASREHRELVRREHDRLRAAAYRARKKDAAALPKRITAVKKHGVDLIKAAKGALARNR